MIGKSDLYSPNILLYNFILLFFSNLITSTHKLSENKAYVVAEFMGDLTAFKKANPSIEVLPEGQINFILHDLPFFCGNREYVLKKDLKCVNDVPVCITMKLIKSFERIYRETPLLNTLIGKKCNRDKLDVFYVSIPIKHKQMGHQHFGPHSSENRMNLEISGILNRLFVRCDFEYPTITGKKADINLDCSFCLTHPPGIYNITSTFATEQYQYVFVCFDVYITFSMSDKYFDQRKNEYTGIISITPIIKKTHLSQGEILDNSIFKWPENTVFPSKEKGIEPEKPPGKFSDQQDDKEGDSSKNYPDAASESVHSLHKIDLFTFVQAPLHLRWGNL